MEHCSYSIFGKEKGTNAISSKSARNIDFWVVTLFHKGVRSFICPNSNAVGMYSVGLIAKHNSLLEILIGFSFIKNVCRVFPSSNSRLFFFILSSMTLFNQCVHRQTSVLALLLYDRPPTSWDTHFTPCFISSGNCFSFKILVMTKTWRGPPTLSVDKGEN